VAHAYVVQRQVHAGLARLLAGAGGDDDDVGPGAAAGLDGVAHGGLTSALTRAEVRSSVASARRFSASSPVRVVSSMPALTSAMPMSSLPVISGSPTPRMALVARSTVPTSLRGMPIMSQMTSSGRADGLDQVDLAFLAHAVDHLGADALDGVDQALQASRR
jgi:hypothetical protein